MDHEQFFYLNMSPINLQKNHRHVPWQNLIRFSGNGWVIHLGISRLPGAGAVALRAALRLGDSAESQQSVAGRGGGDGRWGLEPGGTRWNHGAMCGTFHPHICWGGSVIFQQPIGTAKPSASEAPDSGEWLQEGLAKFFDMCEDSTWGSVHLWPV